MCVIADSKDRSKWKYMFHSSPKYPSPLRKHDAYEAYGARHKTSDPATFSKEGTPQELRD